MKEVLRKDITEVVKDRNILNMLSEIGIKDIKELCSHSRMELSEKGISKSSVNDIRIALQLNGIDLKPNHARKNSLILR